MTTKFKETFYGLQPCQVIQIHQCFREWPDSRDGISLCDICWYKPLDVVV